MNGTASIWLTDGSPAPFVALHRLASMHPTILGAPGPYKGIVDPAVFVGSATIDAERSDDALFAEAEWCVTFPDGVEGYLSDPEGVGPSTPVSLQGMIEGKWLNRFLGRMGEWKPASLGNNLLAEGLGIATTLGAIEEGAAIGQVEVSYRLAGGRGTRNEISTLRDLHGQNILALVREVLRFCRDHGERIDGIDLGAMGERAAVVNEGWRFREAAESLPMPGPPTPEAIARIGEHVIQAILAEGIGAPPEEPIRIVTRGEDDEVVGDGVLTWHAWA